MKNWEPWNNLPHKDLKLIGVFSVEVDGHWMPRSPFGNKSGKKKLGTLEICTPIKFFKRLSVYFP